MNVSLRMLGVLFALPIASGSSMGQLATCPGSGLSVTGGRLGDAFSVDVSGPPGAPAILASDVVGGPVTTPYGSICLGMSPGLVITPVSLDTTGHFGLAGLLPLAPPFPAGSTQFLQAAMAHPSLPGGFSLTNGVAVTVRPPSVGMFRNLGWSYSVFTGGSFSSTLDIVNAATDQVATSLPVVVWPGTRVSHTKQGWYGWPIVCPPLAPYGSYAPLNSYYFVDDLTGANVLTIPNAFSMPGGTHCVSDDGDYLWVTLTGTAPQYDRFWVKTYSLPTGSQLSQGVVSSLQFESRGIYPVPGTSLAYLAAYDKFHVVDGATGMEVATVNLPGPLDGLPYYPNRYAFMTPGMLYCCAYSMIIGIDTTTHTIAAGPAPLYASILSPLAIGPGSNGPALWASTHEVGTPGHNLIEVPLATLTPIPVATLPFGATFAEPSAGGTEMLIQAGTGSPLSGCLPSAVDVLAVNAATHAIVTVAGVGRLCAVPSDTLHKAYGTSTYGVLKSFPTDPCDGTSALVLAAPPALMGQQLISN